LTIVSMVEPRFSNSADSTLAIVIFGASAATSIVESIFWLVSGYPWYVGLIVDYFLLYCTLPWCNKATVEGAIAWSKKHNMEWCVLGRHKNGGT
jgi:hypothetical protein